MKILNLKMNAFLAYKDYTEIDFEAMIDHGLYLISGATGSGKTTIFDAITFALYGVASGNGRNFRSDYADAKEETYVEMTFSLHQNIYKIKRSPTYYRQGYKTAKQGNAYLYEEEKIIEGVKEVNHRVIELIGVDVHQFKQIVMIAQGEFTKLIYASSEDREKVLRHIFHSESLVQFENSLKQKTKEYKDRYTLSSQNILSQFQMLLLDPEFLKAHQTGFHPSYIEEASYENDKVHVSYQAYLQDYQVMKKLYEEKSQDFYQKEKQNQDILQYQKIQQQYQAHLTKQADMNQLEQDIKKLQIIQEHQSLIQQYQSIKEDHRATQDLLEHIKQRLHENILNYQESEKHFQHIQNYKQKQNQSLLEIEKLKMTLHQQKQYQEVQTKYEQQKKRYDKKLQEQLNVQDMHEKLVTRMERDQDKVNALPDLQLALQKEEQLVKESNEKRIAIHELSELYDQFKDIQDKHFELSETYKVQDQIYQKVLAQYNHEDEIFKRQQAGIMASTLKENEPCPVCGSLHHPKLARLSSEVLTSQQLESLYQKVEQEKSKKDEAYNEVLLHNETIQIVKTKIDVLKQQLHIEEELSKEVFIRLLSNVIQINKQQQKKFHKQLDEVTYLKRVQKSLERDHFLENQQRMQLESVSGSLNEMQSLLSGYQSQLLQMEKDHPQILSETLEADYRLQLHEYNTLKKNIEDIEENYYRLQKDISILQGQKDNEEKRMLQLQDKYQRLDKQYQQFIECYFQTDEQHLYYKEMFPKLQDKQQILQNYIIQKRSLESQLETLKEDIKDHQFIDMTIFKEELETLEKQKDDVYKKVTYYLHVYENNQKIIDQIKKEYIKNQDIFEKYTLYQDLYDHASGKNNQRMSFERYVLSAYFENILEYANIELLKMSQGRFELYRKQEIKGNKQQGLDLSVLDYETGLLRDIRSLSGGESFKAALSLALGLSSMIQSYAGGIELDTLFIDEGFGSLDSESIDQALSVLLELKNDHKVIGIISHVRELKERIQTQIIVEKGKCGSQLHIELQ